MGDLMVERRSQQNPARLAEQKSLEFITTWLGGDGVVAKVGDGDEPDFRIDYPNGYYALGEVKAAFNLNFRKMWSAIDNSEMPQEIELPFGTGCWSCQINVGSNIDILTKSLPYLIQTVRDAGSMGFDLFDDWPRGEVPDLARSMGINRLHHYPDLNSDRCIFLVKGVAGAVPDEPNEILEWLSDFFSSDRYERSWTRLKDSDCDEKHVFIWIGEAVPESVQLSVIFHPDRPPSSPPPIPSWITHLWMGVPTSFKGGYFAWLYQSDHGWQVIGIPFS